VNFVARVTTAGDPLKEAVVEIVSDERGQPVTIATGKVVDGALSVNGNPGPVWGIQIDKQPVIAIPVSVEGDTVNLGDIDMVADGVAWPAFHAIDGRVFGIPRIPRPKATTTTAASLAGIAFQPADITRLATLDRSAIAFGELYGNTARQLDVAATTGASRFALAGATVTLKGIATTTADDIGLKFPTPEAPIDGAPVSEISFTIQPKTSAAAAPPTAASTSAPNLVGYTREFAVRKAAASSFLTEISHEIVSTDSDAGRVIRQLPPPGASLPAGGLIRVFVGKREGS